MTEDSEKTRVQKLLSKVTDRPIVAYILVVAAILGGIASFTGTVEKIYDTSTNVLAHLSNRDDPKRAQSIWINIGGDDTGYYATKDETGENSIGIPKAGHYMQVIKPIKVVIEDPLPLSIPSMDGAAPKPRKLPLYNFHSTNIPAGVYRLLDVDIVELTASERSNLLHPREFARISDSDQEEYRRILSAHTLIWARLENLKTFGNR